ncbi:MAG: tetratricopeptide repeat protein [Anaerolineales bacterium]|nr:MAG: tetratricopeptide repeat protein [Anaerolineales bacterium]
MAEPQVLREEGLRYYRQGALDEAIACFVEAHSLYIEKGDQSGAAEVLNNLGVIYYQQERWSEATEALEKVHQAFIVMEDVDGQAQTSGNLGSLYGASGQLEKAAQHFKDALTLFHQLGDSQAESTTWRALSTVRLRQRRWLEAISAYDSSLTCLKRLSLGQRLLHLLLGLPLRLLSGAR